MKIIPVVIFAACCSLTAITLDAMGYSGDVWQYWVLLLSVLVSYCCGRCG